MPAKLLTLPVPPRKRAANRVRRLRGGMSREAFVEILREQGVEVSARTLGDIERGRVRMTALEIVEAVTEQDSGHRIGKSAEVPAGCEKPQASDALNGSVGRHANSETAAARRDDVRWDGQGTGAEPQRRALLDSASHDNGEVYEVPGHTNVKRTDFVFSCPPYSFLERYSDDPRDLSAMDWFGFLGAYREIIAAASARLRANRFAAFVVGDVRSDRGEYLGLVPETIRAFRDAGLGWYNDIVLVGAVGSGSLRAARQFTRGRKVVKLHQQLLVFVKGDWRKAAAECAEKAA